MKTNQKISGAENTDRQAFADELEYLKKLPNKLEQDLENLENDRKRAKRGLIIPCVIFGTIIVWQLIATIIRIVNHDYGAVMVGILIIVMDSICILYEILLYNNRISMTKLYALNCCMLVDWAKSVVQGLERETELTREIVELKKGKAKNPPRSCKRAQ